MTIEGKVIRYNEVKGFGFIRREEGDVFVHVRDLAVPAEAALLRPGCLVSYDLADGSRGLKAVRVRVLQPDGGAAAGGQLAGQPVLLTRDVLWAVWEEASNCGFQAFLDRARANGWVDG